jgi:uncharacterized protein
MARILTGLVAGILFGVGLAVSEMINPAKVLNFLDIFGHWDASLAFVMLGAVVTAAIGYRLAFLRERPLFEAKFVLPTRQDVDARLLAGSALFGIGWGLGGYCPGPAISGLAFGALETIAFVAAMAVGMIVWRMMSTMAPRSGAGEDSKWTTQRS